jgi:hypothetical protein
MYFEGRSGEADEVGRVAGAGEILPLPRNTQSAATATSHMRGLAAVLARYPTTVQHAIRQECLERLDILGRYDAVMRRFQRGVDEGLEDADAPPDILVQLQGRLAENADMIRRTVKSAEQAQVIVDALEDEDYRGALSLPVDEEDAAFAHDGATDGPSARMWRRKLDTRKASRKVLGKEKPLVPSRTGDKTVWDSIELAKRDSTAGLSYYQLQQRKYGRNRRGSTAVAGAWEEVFGVRRKPAPVPPPVIPSAPRASGHERTPPAGHKTHEVPRASGQERALAAGRKTHEVPPAEEGEGSTIAHARAVLSAVIHAAKGGDDDSSLLGEEEHAPRSHGADLAFDRSGPRSVSSFRGRGTPSVFTTGDIGAVLPTIRRTAAAVSVVSKQNASGIGAVLASLPLKAQQAARLLCAELAELVSRYETTYERHVEALGREPDDDEELPDVLRSIDRAVASTRDALVRAVGDVRAHALIEIVQDPDTRAAMGLGAESEDFQETEEDARLWRRRLGRFKSRLFDPSSDEAVDEYGGSGQPSAGRDLFGASARSKREGADNVSYYQRQQKKYGRGRRGSTSYSGAWEDIFSSQDTPGSGAPRDGEEVDSSDEALRLAQEAAASGDPSKVLELASRLAGMHGGASKLFSPMH